MPHGHFVHLSVRNKFLLWVHSFGWISLLTFPVLGRLRPPCAVKMPAPSREGGAAEKAAA